MSNGVRLGSASLVATGCGTAIAAVCALGLAEMQGLAPGAWSALAVLLAGLLCAALARALSRLATVLPGGAGLLAYLARGLGRRRGPALVLPYLLLTLFLVGAEATLVGRVVGLLTPVPAWLGAGAFLVLTWALCRLGLHVGHRVQAAATWALIGGLCGLSLLALQQAAAQDPGGLVLRLLPPPPPAPQLLAAVGQAIFLFLGFELITAQAGLCPAATLGSALRGSVALLTGFYALLALGFCAAPRAAAADPLLPQLAMAVRAGGRPALLAVAGLTLLASFTSFHGALLTLSRLCAALATQGLLPRQFARVDARSLLPRQALLLLLVLCAAATALVGLTAGLVPSILAAAAAAALVYGAVLWVREGRPFAEPGRARWRRIGGRALGLLLAGLAVGVVFGAPAGAAPGALALLLLAYGAAIFTLFRGRAPRSAPAGAIHAD